MVNIEPSWHEALRGEFSQDYFTRLTEFVHAEYAAGPCFPPGKEIFAAFDLCPLDKVRVVIIGQDPYHEPGQAEGLCFSVKTGVNLPPSLVNIFREVKDDVDRWPEVLTDATGRHYYDGSLRRWARQGVLLLNATLTVRAHLAASHQRHGWEQFTDAAIQAVSKSRPHCVFLLWGGFARQKKKLIDQERHLVLEAAHPSPLSANRGGWFGCRHFSKCNRWLRSHGLDEIKW